MPVKPFYLFAYYPIQKVICDFLPQLEYQGSPRKLILLLETGFTVFLSTTLPLRKGMFHPTLNPPFTLHWHVALWPQKLVFNSNPRNQHVLHMGEQSISNHLLKHEKSPTSESGAGSAFCLQVTLHFLNI